MKMKAGALEVLACEESQTNMGGLAIALTHGSIMFEWWFSVTRFDYNGA